MVLLMIIAAVVLLSSGCDDMLSSITRSADVLLDLAARPGIAWVLISMVAGELSKRWLWTKERAALGRPRWLWLWGRRLLPLHAVAVGAVVGLFLEEGPLYYAALGLLSSWLFDLLQSAARRYEVDLSLPGNSEPPPEDPEATPRLGIPRPPS